MAYLTGSTFNYSDFFDTLITFATGSCGWTLVDPSASSAGHDKVISSSGTDGMTNMIYRFMLNTEFLHPVSGGHGVMRGMPEAHTPAVLARGYRSWDSASHLGFNEWGRFGPWMLRRLTDATSGIYFTRLDVPYVPFTYVADSAWRTAYGDAVSTRANSPWNAYDGSRRVYTVTGYWDHNYVNVTDLSTGYSKVTAGPAAATADTLDKNRQCFVHDTGSDKLYIFMQLQAAAQVDFWYRFDCDALTWQRMGYPPWTTACSGSVVAYDGSTYIYCVAGGGKTNFAKYNVQTDTWTSLSPLPVTATFDSQPGNGGVLGSAIYAAAEVFANNTHPSGAVYFPKRLGYDATLLCYDIATDQWNSGSALTLPINPASAYASITFDGVSRIYCHNWTSIYYTDISMPTTGTWTFMSPGLFATTTRSTDHIIWSHAFRAKMSPAMSETKFWFFGDADSIKIATRNHVGRYYWASFGRYDSLVRKDVAVQSANTSAGYNVVTPVSMSSNAIVQGDYVMFWDPSGSTNSIERCLVTAVSGSSITTNNSFSHSSGCLIGVDPCQFCLVSDKGFMATPLDSRGWRSSYDSAIFYLSGAISPTETTRCSPSARGFYLVSPIYGYGAISTLPTYETIGILRGVYLANSGSWPAPITEDTMNVNGQPHIVFNSFYGQYYASMDSRLIVIGPAV